MTVRGRDFRSIREWRGSRDQAFEEFCYQLRDSVPEGAVLVKTGSPDGGLEWYVTLRNGVQWGWQAKFVFDIGTLLRGMEKSLRTVVKKRPACRRLTFCIPFDLPDAPGGGERKSAREKFEDRKRSWRERIPGADRVRVELWSEGELLERLVHHPARRGMEWFFWDKEVFSPGWCKKRQKVTAKAAGGRYSPELHVGLPVTFPLEGLAPVGSVSGDISRPPRCCSAGRRGGRGLALHGHRRHKAAAGSCWVSGGVGSRGAAVRGAAGAT